MKLNKTQMKVRDTLERLALDTLPLFRLTPLEERLLRFVLRRTLGWGRLEEHIPISILIGGMVGGTVRLAGVGCDRVKLWRTRKSLVEKGLLFFEERGGPGHNSQWYIPNVCGMWEVWNYFLSSNGEATKGFRDKVEEVVSTIRRVFERKEWPVQALANKGELIMNLEEEVAKARKNSEYARMRRREKQRKKPVSVSMIPALMKEFTADEDLGVRYSEEESTIADVKRVKRSMRNWLGECERREVDPREQLRKVCENWTDFSSELYRDDGTEIGLPPQIVSFDDYYRYRRQIDRWLIQKELDQQQRGKEKVINLEEKRQGREEPQLEEVRI